MDARGFGGASECHKYKAPESRQNIQDIGMDEYGIS
jgi:hypothetical protein